MAGKRNASSELNHDNWDDDDEAEEAGQFKRAPDEVISKRVIKVARRRNPLVKDESGNTPSSVFGNFSGFTKPSATATSSASPFAFLSNLTSTKTTTNGLSSTSTTSNTSTPSTTTLFRSPNSTSNIHEQKSVENTSEKTDLPDAYLEKLQGLNESLTAWISTHVGRNPYCILTEVFKDYEKHLAEIDKLKEQKTPNTDFKIPTVETKTSEVASAHSALVFGKSDSKTLENPFLNKLSNTPEQKPKETVSSPSGFTFGNPKVTPTPSGFSFGTGTPFTFSNVAKPTSDRETNEEDEEPPKNDFKPVVEDDSIFTKRCKVFVKKDDAFMDRGVGQLFLKPVENSEKVQLIVRQDTSLGNLLLNLILSKSIPIKRMGKNNVMLVCIPDEKSKPPPVPVLLRVKTSEEADELLEILEKQQK